MTVYSINKRAIEQAATSAANATKSTSDAAAEFASALKQAGSLLATTPAPSAETALKVHFDRSAEPTRQTKAEHKTERAEAKSSVREQRDDAKSTRRADKAETKETRREQKADKAEQTPERAEPVAEDATDDTPVAADRQDSQQNAGQQQQDAPQPQAVAAPVQAPQQQVEDVAVEGDALAGAQKAAPTNAERPAENQAADLTGGDDDDAPQAAAAAETQQAGAPKEAAENHKAVLRDHATQSQADDLAQRLDGTGARLNVQVQVAANSQSADTATAADLPATPQEAIAAPLAATAENAGSNTESGNQQPSLAQATQQAAAAKDAAEAAALAGRQAQVKPFDAALAAQLEASSAPATSQTSQPATQPMAGLGGVTAGAAAQKASAPQAAQAARQPQLPEQQQIMDQVKVQIAKSAKNGGDTIKVQLKPVELGAIEIKVEVAQDGRVSAIVTADNKATLDALQKDASSLQKALEDAGLKPDANSLAFNLREGQGQNQQQGSGTSTRRRSRLSVAAAAEAAGAQATAAAQARWSASRSGVDIQV